MDRGRCAVFNEVCERRQVIVNYEIYSLLQRYDALSVKECQFVYSRCT